MLQSYSIVRIINDTEQFGILGNSLMLCHNSKMKSETSVPFTHNLSKIHLRQKSTNIKYFLATKWDSIIHQCLVLFLPRLGTNIALPLKQFISFKFIQKFDRLDRANLISEGLAKVTQDKGKGKVNSVFQQRQFTYTEYMLTLESRCLPVMS